MKVKEEEEPSNDFTGMFEWSDGAKYNIRNIGFVSFWKNGDYHREDGPALIWPDGRKEWYFFGKRQMR